MFNTILIGSIGGNIKGKPEQRDSLATLKPGTKEDGWLNDPDPLTLNTMQKFIEKGTLSEVRDVFGSMFNTILSASPPSQINRFSNN